MYLLTSIECMPPRVNCGLWEIMMCPYKLIDSTNVPLSYDILLVGKIVYTWGKKYIGNMYLVSYFPANQKLL